jgi:DNA-binding transcriptional regulator YiaG
MRGPVVMTGDQARQMRESLGMSVEEMAALLEVGVRTIFRYEAQGVPPGPSAILYRLIRTGAWPPPAG